MDGASFHGDAACDRAMIRLNRIVLQEFDLLGRGILGSSKVRPAVVQPEHKRLLGMAEALGSFDDRIEHGLGL